MQNSMLILLMTFLFGCDERIDVVDQPISGVFYYGHETSAFIRCHTSDIWWVDGTGEAIKSLMKAYNDSGVGSYGNLLVSLRGEFEAMEGNTDYTGTLSVKEFISYSVVNQEITKCVPNIDDLNQ
jgi:hypothetical protein